MTKSIAATMAARVFGYASISFLLNFPDNTQLLYCLKKGSLPHRSHATVTNATRNFLAGKIIQF